MFQKVFEYAGPHKKGLYAATAVVLVSVLMGVLPFVLAYQVIAPLVMGAELDASFLILRVALVLVCLVLQAVLYGWGLNLSHKAAYDTLLRLRTALQKRFEKLPLGVIQDKGTGTVKKLFVDDVDSLGGPLGPPPPSPAADVSSHDDSIPNIISSAIRISVFTGHKSTKQFRLFAIFVSGAKLYRHEISYRRTEFREPPPGRLPLHRQD